MMHDPEYLWSISVEPASFDLIMQKSHKLFREAYSGIARSVVTLDTPGFTDRNIGRLPYRRIPRPIFPLDDVDYNPFQ